MRIRREFVRLNQRIVYSVRALSRRTERELHLWFPLLSRIIVCLLQLLLRMKLQRNLLALVFALCTGLIAVLMYTSRQRSPLRLGPCVHRNGVHLGGNPDAAISGIHILDHSFE